MARKPKPAPIEQHAGPLHPDDPYGDRAALAEERKKKRGRLAIEEAEEFSPAAPPEETAEPDEADDPDAVKVIFKVRRIPRISPKGHMLWTINTVPEECPIVPLGAQGLTYWFLNPRGELVPMEAGKFGLTHIKGLAGDKIGYLEKAWPKFNKQGSWTGFAAENVCDALMTAASLKGVFDPREKVRGRGCWKAEDGRLIQHLGDRVMIGAEEHSPGELAEDAERNIAYVYPARPKLPAPKAGGKADCETIYGHLRTWSWVRGELDARLLLGWMACVVLGAALDWRPMVFWLGDAGTGKSTLQKLVRALLSGRLISTVDATPAALAQLLGADSLGVAFDELEADSLSDQAQHVLKLARTAASGDNRLRGGQDHKAVDFQLRGCFAFSAIVPPSMRPQDVQRFAFLRLQRLPADAKAPKVAAADLRDLGAGLVGRITEGWPRWQETLDAYRAGLERVGHAQRGQDQFGALLAAADLLLHDGAPASETVDQWCAPLAREGLYEYAEAEETWLKAWRHVLAAQPEAWRSMGFPTVGEMVQRYLRSLKRQAGDEDAPPATHQRNLNRAGLAIVHDQRGRPWLAIPSKHQAVQAMFAGNDLQARGGEGAWSNALRGAPAFRNGDGVYRIQQVRQLQRATCTLYRLDAVVDIQGVRTPIFEEDAADEKADISDADYLPDREPGEEG